MGKDTLIDSYKKGLVFQTERGDWQSRQSQKQSLSLRRMGGSISDPKCQKAGAMHHKTNACGLLGESAKGDIENGASDSN